MKKHDVTQIPKIYRNRQVHVKLTEDEYQAFKYLSKKSKMSMSEIIRRGVNLLNARELKINLSGKRNMK